MTTFVGREREIAQVRDLMARPTTRLLTLSGPPGIGKTRLALQVPVGARFPDGVFFVQLGSIRDPDLVPSSIAATLGVGESSTRSSTESLKQYLADKEALLILDNFEQLIPAAPLLGELLARAPHIKVLVTSRELLRIYGEHNFPVPPLSVPDLRTQSLPEDLMQHEAVRLFVERATAVKPDFVLTAENAPAVAEICVRLDGLPLAIELAAARVLTFSSQDLLARLSSRLNVLVEGPRDLPQRQQTLRGAVEWSYNLLDEAEQTLFRRLSVFAGGCTPDAVEAITNYGSKAEEDQDKSVPDPQASIHNLLQSLVNKSLLRIEKVEEPSRFWMLETIASYADEKLEESGDAEPTRLRHALYYGQLAEATESHLKGPQQGAWLDRIESEHDNIRRALAQALETQQVELALRMAGGLWRFWVNRGHMVEGLAWLRSILDLADEQTGTEVSRAILAGAFNSAGNLAFHCGDYAAASIFHGKALETRRDIADEKGIAASLSNLANVMREQGDYDGAAALFRESLSLKRQLGDTASMASTMNNLGLALTSQGQFEAARELYEESTYIWRDLGDKAGVAISLSNLGINAAHMGDFSSALAYYGESLELRRELGDRQGIATVLHNLGEVELCRGDFGRARALYEESLTMRREMGDSQGVASSLSHLGHTFLWQGDVGQATELFRESLALHVKHGSRPGVIGCLVGLGSVATVSGQPERALRIFGACRALAESAGFHLHPADRHAYDRFFASACNELDKSTCEVLFAEGYAMGEDIVGAVLQQSW